jgi:multidrug efflux pump subunit AcrA (membrane-fusion protein)
MKMLKNKWFISIFIIIVLLIAFSIFKASSKTYKWVTASTHNLKEEVSVTGKVAPIQKSDLSFGKSGIVSNIWFKVGDTIKAQDVIASLNDSDDRSSYMAYQASYQNTAKGLTNFEAKYEKDKLETSKANYESTLRSAIVSARDSYTKAQSSFLNGIDQFFTNPQSVNPTINIFLLRCTVANSLAILNAAIVLPVPVCQFTNKRLYGVLLLAKFLTNS